MSPVYKVDCRGPYRPSCRSQCKLLEKQLQEDWGEILSVMRVFAFQGDTDRHNEGWPSLWREHFLSFLKVEILKPGDCRNWKLGKCWCLINLSEASQLLLISICCQIRMWTMFLFAVFVTDWLHITATYWLESLLWAILTVSLLYLTSWDSEPEAKGLHVRKKTNKQTCH